MRPPNRTFADILQEGGHKVKKKSGEVMVRCAFHDDATPSCSVNLDKEVFHCKACGASGGALKWLTQQRKISTGEAKKILYGDPPAGKVRPKRKPAPRARPPKPKPLPAGDHFIHYRYLDEGGRERLVVVRENLKKGGKKIRQFTPEGDGYLARGLTEQIPLFRLAELRQAGRDELIYIFEGEKACLAAAELLSGEVCLAWAGGTNAWRKSDWKPVAGRQVVLVADADTAGRRCMTHLGEFLEVELAATVLVVLPDGETGKDAADVLAAGGSGDDYHDELIAAAQGLPDNTPDFAPDPPPEMPSEPPPPDIGLPAGADPADDNPHFAVLGRDDDDIIIRRKPTNYIHRIRMTQLERNFLVIAPLSHWEGLAGSPQGGLKRRHMLAISNSLIREAERKGRYNPAHQFGRGANFDNGRIVYSLGDCLLADGETIELTDPKLQYVYHDAIPLRRPGEPAAAEERAAMNDLVCSLSWEEGWHGTILLGWIGASIACGVLSWRPSIWINAPSQSGKSWLLNNVINRVFAGHINWGTGKDLTPASVARDIGSDAMPFIYDESESGDDEGIVREVQRIMRISSTPGGVRMRASMNSKSKNEVTYPRACFMFSSTNIRNSSAADRSRYTVLQLGANRIPNEKWDRLARKAQKVFEHGGRLRDYFLLNIDKILAVTEQAKANLQALHGSAITTRSVEQIAPMVACGFLATGRDSTEAQEDNEAWDYLCFAAGKLCVEEHAFDADEADSLLQHMLACLVRFSGKIQPRTILQILQGEMADDSHEHSASELALRGMGIRIDLDLVTIAPNHPGFRRIFRGSAWEHSSLRHVLGRSSILHESRQTRYGQGRRHRSFVFRLAQLLDLDPMTAPLPPAFPDDRN